MEFGFQKGWWFPKYIPNVVLFLCSDPASLVLSRVLSVSLFIIASLSLSVCINKLFNTIVNIYQMPSSFMIHFTWIHCANYANVCGRILQAHFHRAYWSLIFSWPIKSLDVINFEDAQDMQLNLIIIIFKSLT